MDIVRNHVLNKLNIQYHRVMDIVIVHVVINMLFQCLDIHVVVIVIIILILLEIIYVLQNVQKIIHIKTNMLENNV